MGHHYKFSRHSVLPAHGYETNHSFKWQRLQAGVLIEVAAHAMALDLKRFPEPDKFGSLRYYKLRDEKTEEDKQADRNNDTR